MKSNIGHPESAAGVAGLIKAVLSVEHDVLFPSLHYSRPNPLAEFGERFYVNTSRQQWEATPHPRRAGVNSLGIGGTNAFAIVEQAPSLPVDFVLAPSIRAALAVRKVARGARTVDREFLSIKWLCQRLTRRIAGAPTGGATAWDGTGSPSGRRATAINDTPGQGSRWSMRRINQIIQSRILS